MPDIETLAVIPARLGSTRLPEKPLIKLAGRELVLRVLDGVRGASLVDRVIVATDDERVASVVRAEGGEAMLTPCELPTGSDRVAFAARQIPSRFVLNVQGDDPLISGAMIDSMINALKRDEGAGLAVLAKKIDKPDEIKRDSIVKMVFDGSGRALYFSRSPIPFVRDTARQADSFKHIGPYAWRREALFEFASWEQTPLERAESLEMLRMLERGRTIMCIPTDKDSIEIDTPDDILMFERYLKEGVF
ncbi:MAG: 3-deoxy-manno-octulosonate cytidylyltransferase [Synergistaceae bacterium]|jgi:3-deoxy-manno-octulosonate cytidylyltransferase (CMP-KDO synthetase)|nr:3-deoxy-manno-octulosonate cytidylyltransferase [Synergistaceae bacterium]